ncbi:archaellin/type IV pilin N-terminal domain-containing protein [Caldiplasma sukawensis]
MKSVFEKKEKAVTPIIATILLIAITVVLATTLITILSSITNFTSQGSIDSDVSLQGPFPVSGAAGENCYYLNITSTSTKVSMVSITVEIFDSNGIMYKGSLGNVNTNNLTINTGGQSYFTAGDVINILSKNGNRIDNVYLIYADEVFNEVTPTT